MKRAVDFLKRIKAGRIIAVFTAVILTLVMFYVKTPEALADGENAELPYGGEFGPCEIHNKIKGVSGFSSTDMRILTEEEAAEQAPKGAKGYVLTANPGSNIGFTFDFRGAGINIYTIESISIRVYVEATDEDVKTGDSHYPEIRIPFPGKTDQWIMKYDISAKTNRWQTLVIYPDGKNLTSEAKTLTKSENAFTGLADEEGNLAAFEVAVRRQSGKGNFFIDSIKIRYKEDTGEGPVLTYSGPDSLRFAKGAEMIVDATAWDENEERYCPIKLEWEKGVALEEDGYPAVGTKCKLIISSTDGFGNRSECSVDAEVAPEDKNSPVVTVGTDTIKCLAGSVPQMRQGGVEDDLQIKSVIYEWQDGALDKLGRLNEGTFELKVTATDTSGNVTEKTFKVIGGGPELFAEFNVTDDEKG